MSHSPRALAPLVLEVTELGSINSSGRGRGGRPGRARGARSWGGSCGEDGGEAEAQFYPQTMTGSAWQTPYIQGLLLWEEGPSLLPPVYLWGDLWRPKDQDLNCEGPRLGLSCPRDHTSPAPVAQGKLWRGDRELLFPDLSVLCLSMAVPRVGVGSWGESVATLPDRGART